MVQPTKNILFASDLSTDMKQVFLKVLNRIKKPLKIIP